MPKIFLSPSTQEWNKYLSEGNEELWMNMLADKMEPYLRSSGIQYVRNDPEKNVRGAIDDSNSDYYDAHIALHTNAGGEEFAGKLRGIDVYYSPFSKAADELAVTIANNLEKIYPFPNKVSALSTTSLGELSQTKATAILAELGYHDNPEDEAWIKNNLNAMAANLVESIADYFGIPFIIPKDERMGVVNTGFGNLNLRSFPSSTGTIIDSIPNRTKLSIFGEYKDWYVTSYNGQTGYANKNFIDIV